MIGTLILGAVFGMLGAWLATEWPLAFWAVAAVLIASLVLL